MQDLILYKLNGSKLFSFSFKFYFMLEPFFMSQCDIISFWNQTL